MEKCIFTIGIILLIHDLADGFSLNNFRNTLNLTHRTKRQFSSFKCTLPEHPANGQWRIIKGEGKPGDQVDINTVLKIECEKGYRLNPMQPFVACAPNWNLINFPTCEKKCPSFYTTATAILTCVDRNGNKIDCNEAVDGTYLTYECIAYYEIPPGYSRSLFCREGDWDSKPICQPVCGKKINRAIQLSYGGRVVKDLEYPWVVALFRKEANSFTNICGGTLLNKKVIVTAAHCVTNDAGDTLSKDIYEVAAGQYYNAYKDPRDVFSQYKKVAKIIVKNGYRGSSQKFIADIAIIVVEGYFQLGPAVQPICINNQVLLQPNQIGEVAGWGRTENHTAADRLRVIKVPLKDQATCRAELPADWEEQHNVLDKICAGHYMKNISVCKGDSGSGLVFKNLEDGRYYIHGIVSIAPSLRDEDCNFENNALYTNIKSYFEFVDLEIQRHNVKDCKLPPYPENGKWSIVIGPEKNPGEVVLSFTVLQFTCNRGYKLSPNRELIKCLDIQDIPTCDVLCPIPDFPKNTVISCKNKKGQLIVCADATDGSSITYSCPAGFVSDQGTQSNTRYCFDGTYDFPPPNCIIFSGSKCTLPEHPANGRWHIIKKGKTKEEGKPGDQVDEKTVIGIDCLDGYKLNSMQPFVTCDSNWDSRKFPTCKKKCPSLANTATTILKCFDKNGNKIDCDQAVDGSYLTYECIAHYEIPSDYPERLYCREGTWDYPVPACRLVCGKKITNQTILYEGNMDYPWAVSIFKKIDGLFKYICGGTLLNTKVIVTTAHCVATDDGDILPKDNFEVAAGQYYYDYKDPRNKYNQYKKVAEIVIKNGYRGFSRNYLADIAIIVVEGFFESGPAVQPVCIRNQPNIILQSNEIGEVAGWGITKNHTADHIRINKVVYKDQATCRAELPTSWEEQFNLPDKICAGYYKKDMNVCRGDSGNGLVFKNPDDERYYIHGIVVLAPNTPNCDTNILYTSIKYYFNFIDGELRKHHVDDCKLPPYPKKGKWSIVDGAEKNPGEMVLWSTALQFSCNKGYILSSYRENVKCRDIEHVPTCDKKCPSFYTTNTTILRCVNKDGNEVDCAEAVDGTYLTYECIAYYEIPSNYPKRLYCREGTWDYPLPVCRPVCGKKINNETIKYKGKVVEDMENPWVVSIFKKNDTGSFINICGGTLLNTKVIVTVAHCVTNHNGDPLSKDKYEVAAAKYFYAYKDPRDVLSQYKKVAEIVIEIGYRGYSRNYLADIAIIVIEGFFEFGPAVQPVCISNQPNILQPNEIGEVVGWGITENHTADHIQINKVVYKDQATCSAEFPTSWEERFNLPDKICAGYYRKDMNVCKGDSGNGLVFKNHKDEKYYIHGIVSQAPISPNCETNILYTSVKYYFNFIDGKLRKHRV